jgi:hypothetical protein
MDCVVTWKEKGNVYRDTFHFNRKCELLSLVRYIEITGQVLSYKWVR